MANKPEFDPNQPFTVEGEAPEFDPEQPFTVGNPEPVQAELTTPDSPFARRDIDPRSDGMIGADFTGESAPKPQEAAPFFSNQRNSTLQSIIESTNPIEVAKTFANDFASTPHRMGEQWGLPQEIRRYLGAKSEMGNETDALQNLPADLADLGYRGLQGLFALGDAGMRAVLPDSVVEDPGFQALLAEFGRRPIENVGPARLTPADEARYVELLNKGSVSDIHEFIGERNLGFKPGDVERYVEARDANKPVETAVRYEDQYPQIERGEIKFDTNRPYTTEEQAVADKLQDERRNFRPSQDPTPEELFAPKRPSTPEEFEAGLQKAADEFAARKAEPEAEPTPETVFGDKGEAPIEATPEPQPHPLTDEVARVTAGWKNAPEFEIVNSVDEIADPVIRAQSMVEGDDALGFLGPDGKVRIIANNIRDPSEIPALIFHEGLGHHGLAQKFGSGLEGMMQQFYDTNKGDFRTAVDKWIADNPDLYKGPKQTVRAAEEVLAEMSEKGQIPLLLKDRIANFIKALSRKMGLRLSYSDREINTILAMAHDAVINGKGDARSNGFRYSRMSDADSQALIEYSQANSIKPSEVNRLIDTDPQVAADIKARADQIRGQDLARRQTELARDGKLQYMRRRKEDGTEVDTGNVNVDRLSTVNDVDKLLDELSKEHPREPVSWAETKREARELGLNPSKVAKGKGVGDLSARITAYRQVQANVLDEVAQLGRKLEDEFSPTLQANYLRKVAQLSLVHARVQGDVAEIGRALNAMKILTQSNLKAAELVKALSEHGGPASALADSESFMKFARSVQAMLDEGNPAGAANLMTKVMKPYWEDYIITGRHAMMLSGLGTHYKNIVDNFGMIAREFEETALAGAMKGFRGEITPQEMGARVYGLMRAALDGETYRKTAAAFMKGHENRHVSSKVEIEGARIPGVSKILDTLHAEDTFFRSFMDSTNLYALGMRKAKKEGFKGTALLEQGSHYAQNPTKEMLAEAREMADVALVVSQPSWFVQKIEAAKARKLEMDFGERLGRFAAHIVFPFARVTDRLLAQKLARSPLSFMDSKTRADFKAGGARRDVAIARTLYGTAIIGYYVWAANNDKTTGAGPEFKKKAALEAGGYLSNAYNDGDEYVDATALNTSPNPFSLRNSLAADVATIVHAYKGGDDSGQDYLSKIGRVTASFIATLGSSSFAENIAPYTDAYKDIESGQGGSASAANVIGGLGTSFVPTAVRQVNSAVVDPIRRDTTGDKSFGDRVKGRVEASIPGLSDNLPVKYDLYGRPLQQGKNISGVNNRQKIDKDPTVREIQALERTTSKPVVTAPNPSFSINGQAFKLTGEKYAEYQRVAGTRFLEEMKKITPLPGWRKADVNTKKAAIKELLKETREAARLELIQSGVISESDIQPE